MHLRCLSGHSLSRHGEQGRSLLIILCPSPRGPVIALSVEPNMAATGTKRAEALCIGPESLLMNASHSEISAISSLRLVFPAIFKIPPIPPLSKGGKGGFSVFCVLCLPV